MLLACTKPGDVVLDPFFGTGTTGAVARRLGRNWIGIERERSYVKVARERIASTLPLDESAMKVMASTSARQPRVAVRPAGRERDGRRRARMLTDAKRRWQAQRLRRRLDRACDGQQGSIHKIGAALQGAPSCNGWTFWHVEQDGQAASRSTRLRQQLSRRARYQAADDDCSAPIFGPTGSSMRRSAMTARSRGSRAG